MILKYNRFLILVFIILFSFGCKSKEKDNVILTENIVQEKNVIIEEKYLQPEGKISMTPEELLIGSWGNQYDWMYFIFNEDGTYELNDKDGFKYGTWMIKPNWEEDSPFANILEYTILDFNGVKEYTDQYWIVIEDNNRVVLFPEGMRMEENLKRTRLPISFQKEHFIAIAEENSQKNFEDLDNNEIKEQNLLDFVYNEILNENYIIRPEWGRYVALKENGDPDEMYGVPIEEKNVNITPVYQPSSNLIGLREIHYEDFIFIYYIFENGRQYFAMIEINHQLDRLETVNIGDTVEKLLQTFGEPENKWHNKNYLDFSDLENSNYWEYDYVHKILFFIENDIISKITVIFTDLK